MLDETCKKHFYCVDQLEDLKALEDEMKKKIEAAGEMEGSQEPEEIDPKRKDQFIWPIDDHEKISFSTWNPDVEGTYMEVQNLEDTNRIVADKLESYNDSNERQRLDLMLYDTLCKTMVKILRAIRCPNGHLILVAMKGFGVN